MKLKTLKYFVATLAVCLSCAATCEGCEDDEQYQKERERVWTALPEATQKGANTIGCYIDGRLWATGDIGYIAGLGFMQRNKAMNTEYICSSYPTKLKISVHSFNRGRIYLHVVSPSEGKSTKIDRIYGDLYNYPYLYDGRKVGEVHITKLDTIRKIVSGTFSADVISSQGDTVQITDGRFDMKLEIL